MRSDRILLLLLLMVLSGCTEMRVEGDAKVFQSSGIGSTIRNVIGLGLIGLGTLAIVGSLLPNRKPKNRKMKPGEGLSILERLGIGIFGGAMGFVGLFLLLVSLLFPGKLHVSVYPDRVVMASNYAQTGGREVVVPFAGLSKVELRDEPGIVGKLKTFLVFTQTSGKVIRQDAGNNERQALETILQSLAEYQKSAPPIVDGGASVTAVPPVEEGEGTKQPPVDAVASAQDRLGQTQVPEPAKEFELKRYAITASLPDGYRVVEPADTFEAGAKLKANWGPNWFIVTVVAVNSDGTITCNWDDFPTYTYKMLRQDLVTVGEEASSSTTTNADSPPSIPLPPEAPKETPPQYSLKRYIINIPLPKGYEIVSPDTEVELGSKLLACYARQWEPVTVIAVNEDGTITCNWDNWTSFTYKMMREDLIIAESNGRQK